jgi:hypothetical protein
MIQLAQININYFYQQIKQNCANYLYINKLSKILLSRCIKQNQLSNELRPLEFNVNFSDELLSLSFKWASAFTIKASLPDSLWLVASFTS